MATDLVNSKEVASLHGACIRRQGSIAIPAVITSVRNAIGYWSMEGVLNPSLKQFTGILEIFLSAVNLYGTDNERKKQDP